jgi:hypothetical protein
MPYFTQAAADNSGFIPTITLSLERPEQFLRSYLSDLNLTFDSPLEDVLDAAERRKYADSARGLIPYREDEQRRFLSPRYENFTPVSNAPRLGNSGVVAAALDRAVDRARGIV